MLTNEEHDITEDVDVEIEEELQFQGKLIKSPTGELEFFSNIFHLEGDYKLITHGRLEFWNIFSAIFPNIFQLEGDYKLITHGRLQFWKKNQLFHRYFLIRGKIN